MIKEKLKPMEMDCKAGIRVNGKARNWKERIGNMLRLVAEKLDHRITLALELETVPALAEEQKHECISQGIDSMQWFLVETTRNELMERLMQYQVPHMYIDQD